MLSWSGGSHPKGNHQLSPTTSLPSAIHPGRAGAHTGCFSPSIFVPNHHHPLLNEALPKPRISLSPSGISAAVNQSIANCVESWYKRINSLKCLSHLHPTPNKMMWKPGRETTAIWSVNQTHVCFASHFQREKKALICQEKKKKLTL